MIHRDNESHYMCACVLSDYSNLVKYGYILDCIFVAKLANWNF